VTAIFAHSFNNHGYCIDSPEYRVNFILSLQVAVPDVVEAAKEADILVFVVPHQFIRTLCSTLLGKIKPAAVGLSLIKVCGLEVLVI
jgi:glycerol-3-phosphate dehydrogenase